jgi:hypothetical protein
VTASRLKEKIPKRERPKQVSKAPTPILEKRQSIRAKADVLKISKTPANELPAANVTLKPKEVSTASYMGVTSPLQLKEFSPRTSSLTSSQIFEPMIMDFSRASVHPDVRVSGWFDEEVHGRWTNGRSGLVFINFPMPPVAPVTLLVILRQTGSSFTGPRSVVVFIDGASCGELTIRDDEFSLYRLRVTDQLTNKSNVKIEFRTSAVFNPQQRGISDDTRDLGVLVSGLVLVPEASTGEGEVLVPGLELVSDAA